MCRYPKRLPSSKVISNQRFSLPPCTFSPWILNQPKLIACLFRLLPSWRRALKVQWRLNQDLFCAAVIFLFSPPPAMIGFKIELQWHGPMVEASVYDMFGFCHLIYLPLSVHLVFLPSLPPSLTLAATVVLGVPFNAFSSVLLSPAECASVLYTFSTTSCDSVCTVCAGLCPLTVLSEWCRMLLQQERGCRLSVPRAVIVKTPEWAARTNKRLWHSHAKKKVVNVLREADLGAGLWPFQLHISHISTFSAARVPETGCVGASGPNILTRLIRRIKRGLSLEDLHSISANVTRLLLQTLVIKLKDTDSKTFFLKSVQLLQRPQVPENPFVMWIE